MAEADIINSLQIGQTRRSMAGYFKPNLVHELRRNTGVLRRWRRKHGRLDLLVVLPSGRKRLIP
jgi:hypothetical protein